MKNICWNITTRCNANCKFCNRMEDAEELEFELNKRILYDLYQCGVKKITWTGGEALLYPRLAELIKLSSELGIKNHLITNGLLLDNVFLKQTVDCLNYITLSLDSCDSKINKRLGRFENQFQIVKNRIKSIKVNQKNCKIKLNTIASSCNLKSIVEITEFISCTTIDRWNIFRFNDFRGIAKSNYTDFSISDEEFSQLKDFIREALTSYGFPNSFVEFLDNDILEKNYILIRADGAVVITRDSKDIILGNLNLNVLTSILSENSMYFNINY